MVPSSVLLVGGVDGGGVLGDLSRVKILAWRLGCDRGCMGARSTYVDLENAYVSSGTSETKLLSIPSAGGGCLCADVPPLQSCFDGGAESQGEIC